MSSVKTQTQTSIKKSGDKVTVTKKITTTTTKPGKEPDVKVTEEVETYEGDEGFKKMPEEIRKQVEEMDKEKDDKKVKPINYTATKGDFVQESLKEHNKYRKHHGVKPLELSEELVKYCKERAKQLCEKDEMIKRTQDKYGENISCMWSSDPEHTVTADEIVERWYGENENYNFNEEPKDLHAGHFTQLVWKNTKEFGIAAAKSDSNKIYVVAAYHPPGNYVNEFKANVLPGSKGKSLGEALKDLVVSATKRDSGSSSDSDDDDVNSKLNKESVKAHNEYRKKHGVGPLKYSKELAKYAQAWADELAKKDKFEHRTERKYGENLYCSSSSDPSHVASAADACASWYSEIKDHAFGAEPRSLKSGHFTQMVWKDSKEVGMGRAKSKSGRQIIVANYNPAGNFVGRYKENVPKPIH